MLPIIDMNIINGKTGRYVRTYNTPIKQVEEELAKLYDVQYTVCIGKAYETIRNSRE